MITKLREEDIEQVTKIHMETMPAGIIGNLGPGFLKNIYYKEYVNSKHAFAFVYKQGNEVLGVTTGCYDSQKFLNQLIRRNKFKLIYYLLRGICEDRQVLKFLLEKILRNNFKRESNLEENIKKQIMDIEAEGMVIAVKPGIQGKGLGKNLHCARLKEFKRKGIEAVKVIVRADNLRNISLHKRFGGQMLHTFKSHGKQWCLIIYRNIQSLELQQICNDDI